MRALAARVGAPLGMSADSPSYAGRRVGQYRVLREIGRGGMGAVYLAERADQQFEKEVAVKLLPLGLGTSAARARFDAERRILARLEHPGIARLLDGGITDDASPFFVMEYVEGTAITEYCRTHALSLEARLRLFAQVCDAVDYAHRRLVVHRDIKPGNILVSSAGEPKLLDFGIAKLEDPEHATDPSPLTDRAGLPMTLAYASPEQVRGETVTTATDVFALGLLLFELLTGRQARQLGGNLDQDLVQVADATVPRPSEVGSESATDPRLLRGDLDTIVAMALRREPARRYRSVAALADDVRRHLDGYPVAARPDTWRYRARKAARRHPALFGFGAAGVIATIAFVTALAFGAQRIAAERDFAERERARAESALGRAKQVTSVLHGLFQSADPRQSLGDTITARQLLERGLARAEDLASEPAAQAELLSVLAGVHQAAGLLNQAAAIGERALAIRTQHLGETHPDVARSLYQLGTMNVPHYSPEVVLQYLERALTIQRSLLPADDLELAQTAVAYAPVLHRVRGQHDSATVLLRTALAVQRRIVGDTSPVLVQTLGHLFGMLRGTGAEADSFARWRLNIQETHAQTPLERATVHADRSAFLQLTSGSIEQALEESERALALVRPVLGDHPVVVQRLMGVGALRERTGRLRPAREALEEAVAIADRLEIVSGAHVALASVLLRADEPHRAVDLLERRIAQWARQTDAPESWVLHQILATALLHAGQASQAMAIAQTAVAQVENALRQFTPALGLYHPRQNSRAYVMLWHGLSASAAGHLDVGERTLREVMASYGRLLRAPADSFYLPSGALGTVPRSAADSLKDRRDRATHRAGIEFHLGLAEAGLAQLLAHRGLRDEADNLLGQGLARANAAVGVFESLRLPVAEELRMHQRALQRGVYAPPRGE
jgi:eukaryotic-like serine/threonine-protein kinase